jgi:hypothetical protein
MNAISLLLLLKASEAGGIEFASQAINVMVEAVYSQKTLHVLHDEESQKMMINEVLSSASAGAVSVRAFMKRLEATGKKTQRDGFSWSLEQSADLMSNQLFTFDGFYTVFCSSMSARQTDATFRAPGQVHRQRESVEHSNWLCVPANGQNTQLLT